MPPETLLDCITAHPGFHTVCLDRWVLQTAYYQYRQQYGNRARKDATEYQWVLTVLLLLLKCPYYKVSLKKVTHWSPANCHCKTQNAHEEGADFTQDRLTKASYIPEHGSVLSQSSAVLPWLITEERSSCTPQFESCCYSQVSGKIAQYQEEIWHPLPNQNFYYHGVIKLKNGGQTYCREFSQLQYIEIWEKIDHQFIAR